MGRDPVRFFSGNADLQLSGSSRCCRKLLRFEKVDVIHDVQSLGYGLLLAKGFGRPVVTTVHHPLTIDYAASLERDRNFKEHYYTVVFYPLKMQRRVIRRLDRVITSSEETAREITRSFRVPPEKIRNVYNGLERNFCAPGMGNEGSQEPALCGEHRRHQERASSICSRP